MRALVALGGNPGTGLDRSPRARKQRAVYERVAELVEADYEVVITQGNGPLFGNVLRKNEPAAGDRSRLVIFSLREIRRLIAFIAWRREPDPAHVIRCSLGQRKHQHRARQGRFSVRGHTLQTRLQY